MLSKTIFMLKLINVGNKRREPMLRLMLIFFFLGTIDFLGQNSEIVSILQWHT